MIHPGSDSFSVLCIAHGNPRVAELTQHSLSIKIADGRVCGEDYAAVICRVGTLGAVANIFIRLIIACRTVETMTYTLFDTQLLRWASQGMEQYVEFGRNRIHLSQHLHKTR